MNNQGFSTDFYIDIAIVWAVPLVLLMVAFILQWPVIKHRYSEYCLMKTIRKSGRDIMRDVVLPDSLGGTTYIEYLALTASSIVIMYLKRYRGVIFAGEKIDEWTQVINNHSYRFPNPLQKLEMDIMAINNLVKDVNVEGKVIFTGGSEFPKGKPASVMSITELEKQKADDTRNEISPLLQTAWSTLQEKAEPCSEEFVQSMRENTAVTGHGLLAAILVLSAIGWVAWKLVG